MLGALIIVFREVIEAGLIVGIVMAATRGVAERGRWVTIGIVGGVLGAGIVAMFRRRHLGRLPGRRPGIVQRERAWHRRGHADVAQRLDGAARPRDRRRDATALAPRSVKAPSR